MVSREKGRKATIDWAGWVMDGKVREFEVHLLMEGGGIRYLPWKYFLTVWRTEDAENDWLLVRSVEDAGRDSH